MSLELQNGVFSYIWGAVRQVWPEAGEQRCWNHRRATSGSRARPQAGHSEGRVDVTTAN